MVPLFIYLFLSRPWDVCVSGVKHCADVHDDDDDDDVHVCVRRYQAGIVIAQESGAVVTGSQSAFLSRCASTTRSSSSSSASSDPFEVTPDVLTGRKYLVVRAMGGTAASSETSRFRRCMYSGEVAMQLHVWYFLSQGAACLRL